MWTDTLCQSFRARAFAGPFFLFFGRLWKDVALFVFEVTDVLLGHLCGVFLPHKFVSEVRENFFDCGTEGVFHFLGSPQLEYR